MDDGEALVALGTSSDPLAADHSIAVVAAGGSRARRALVRDPAFWVGGVLVVLITTAAVLAPILAPHDPLEDFRDLMPLDGSALPPGGQFPLGTDTLGRDYLSRVLYGTRTSLAIALVATTIAVTVGLLVGSCAGLIRTAEIRLPGGGRLGIPVDELLMRLTDVLLAFPVLLLAVAMGFIFGQSIALVTLVIAGVSWTTTARLIYGRVLVLRHAEYIEAARAVGCSQRRILRRHLLPHLLPLIVVYASLGVAAVILFEAALSYVGAGVPRPTPSLGRLIAEAQTYWLRDPRLVVAPGVVIVTTVLAFNLLGDALRDALDPHAWKR